MPLEIVRNDITKMNVDAIVNAANPSLLGGGGVDGAIHRAAGPGLLAECRTLGGCRTGEAKVTGAYDLPARYVIHTVGPIWDGGGSGEKELLQACYRNSLNLAAEKGCETVAFPLISAGVYGYPGDRAMADAVEVIGQFLMNHDMTVYLVVFGRADFLNGKKLMRDVQEYIDDVYVREHLIRRSDSIADNLRRQATYSSAPYRERESMPLCGAMPKPAVDEEEAEKAAPPESVSGKPRGFLRRRTKRPEKTESQEKERSGKSAHPLPGSAAGPDWAEKKVSADSEAPVDASFSTMAPHAAPDAVPWMEPDSDERFRKMMDELLRQKDEGFSGMLLRLIDEKGMTDAECYKRANVDRKLFSKIRSNPDYRPSKPTVFAFAVALELPLSETVKLLRCAGFAMSHSSKFDIILEFFIKEKNYDVFLINEVLFSYDMPLLGSAVG